MHVCVLVLLPWPPFSLLFLGPEHEIHIPQLYQFLDVVSILVIYKPSVTVYRVLLVKNINKSMKNSKNLAPARPDAEHLQLVF